MLVSLCNVHQNLEMNNLSQSEMISEGRPFSQYQLSKNRVASFSAVMSVHVGISLTSEPRQSVMVSRQLKPSSSGSGPIKSIAILSPHSSGIGRGCKGPAGLVVLDLLCWQGMHLGIKDCSRSWRMLGQ